LLSAASPSMRRHSIISRFYSVDECVSGLLVSPESAPWTDCSTAAASFRRVWPLRWILTLSRTLQIAGGLSPCRPSRAPKMSWSRLSHGVERWHPVAVGQRVHVRSFWGCQPVVISRGLDMAVEYCP
jgi:hypothetical protein